VPANSFSQRLGAYLVREKEAHDLSRNPEFGRFAFLGYRTSALAVELVALCDADALTEGDVVRLRDEFFEIVRRLPHDYGLKPNGRNPNGLLCFVFGAGCPQSMARFIARQTRISHAAGSGGVSVAWAIDVPNRRIHTHDNPVSIFPPVIVHARTVYPGLDFMESLLSRIPDEMSADPEASPSAPGAGAGPYPSLPEPVAHPPQPAGGPGTGGGVVPGKIHILFLAANSVDRPLEIDWEIKRIQDDLRASKERDRLEFKLVVAATIDSMMQAMLDDSPTIVHFSGHGLTEGIVLRNEAGTSQLVSGKALASLFKLFRETVHCVVLNACWSEPQARAIKEHIPHVIGTRSEIPDDTAVAFSTGFYKAIGAGRDVPFAYQMGLARVQAEGDDDVGELVALL
jgi:hypothetical protein